MDTTIVSLTGGVDGKLYARRQVDDYAFRGVEFETLGFLSFTVETYERRIGNDNENSNVMRDDDDEDRRVRSHDQFYLSGHPKNGTHLRVARLDDHNVLPNIVGPWLPRRDGEDNSRGFYYASMLALLKPWRDLRYLKNEEQTWEHAFTFFMANAGQRDRDVVSGCQYYYENKNAVACERLEDEVNGDFEEIGNGGGDMEGDGVVQDWDESVPGPMVLFFFVFLE
jgi:hypothetical protein